MVLITGSSAPPREREAEEALDERVYLWIRERIVDGTFQPGERLRERMVSDELKVSRVPIREAFPRLESEGYIKSLHRRGVIVAAMTLQDIAELFTIRSSLEVLTARLAAEECARGANGDHLRSSLLEAEHAVIREDVAGIAEATWQLHEDLLDLANCRLLDDLMIPVNGRLRRLFHIVVDRDNMAVHREHEALCAAVLAGEVDLAAALAFAHVEHSRLETMPIVNELLGAPS
jgi:DNA-binding GntR family transcriptional regulator